MYLLDTNAVSEISKPVPNPGFLTWFEQVSSDELYVSCITLGEIQKGIELMESGARRKAIAAHMANIVSAFEGRVVDIDSVVAITWGVLSAQSQKNGRPAPAIDTMIAAQCIERQLTLVTRNVKDFEQFSRLRILCPWQQ